jgi:hypothetical protein
VHRRRDVEGARRRRPPVHQRRVAGRVVGGQADAADVERAAVVGPVDAAHAQPRLGGVEGDHPLAVEAHRRVALLQRLRVDGRPGDRLPPPPLGVRAGGVEAAVELGDVLLLAGQFGVAVGDDVGRGGRHCTSLC